MNSAIEMTNENHLYLSDLGLVAALSLTFFHEIKQGEKKKVFFVFENSPAIQEAINQYWNGNLSVDAKTYSEQIKSIKSRIYQTQ